MPVVFTDYPGRMCPDGVEEQCHLPPYTDRMVVALHAAFDHLSRERVKKELLDSRKSILVAIDVVNKFVMSHASLLLISILR